MIKDELQNVTMEIFAMQKSFSDFGLTKEHFPSSLKKVRDVNSSRLKVV